MTETRDGTPDEELRLRALHAALAASGTAGQRFLTRHPDRERIPRPETIDTLAWLQWDELEELQHRCGVTAGCSGLSRSPATYIVERRHLEQLLAWRAAARQLTGTWCRLLRLAAAEVRTFTIDVGIELVVRGSRGVEPDALRGWLSPLGASVARRVVDALVARRSRSAAPLSGAGRAAYEEERGQRHGERLTWRLGRRALATSLASVSSDARRCAARAARSNLLELLEGIPPLALERGEEAELEKLLEEIMDGRTGGES